MKHRLCKYLIFFVLLLAMIPTVHASGAGAASSNINKHFYINAQRWNDPITSTLTPEGNGFLRVEAIGNDLIIEHYDGSFSYLSGKKIPLELPIYGGVYIGEDYNFVMVGDKNPEEEDTKEVFRIIRYSKDWKKIDHASIYGANTIVPFQAGCVRFDRSGNTLYIRTSHQMYTSSDGLNHQANVMFALRISDMTITQQLTGIWNSNYGYVSHSFNQFVRVDGNTLLAVDHGDALPRSVCLFQYHCTAGAETFISNISRVDVLPIVESYGHYNDTGVSVGGFECSSTHYLVAGCSYDQKEKINLMHAPRNIFVTATPKNNFSEEGTVVHWLTDLDLPYGYSDVVSPPHLLKIHDDRFFLTWTENGKLRYCFLTGSGALEGRIYSANADLSDCVPILSGNRIVWYVTDQSNPVFYQIDLADLSAVTMYHTHIETSFLNKKAATCTEEGYTGDKVCNDCGKTLQKGKAIPASGHSTEIRYKRDASCTANGYSGDKVCTNCGVTVKTGKTIPASGHKTELRHKKEATCIENGYSGDQVCKKCGVTVKWGNVLWAHGNHTYKGNRCIDCGRAKPPKALPFADVTSGDYFFEPVGWAVDQEITNGVSATEFGPANACTRAHIVTFLWRSAGSPKPASERNSFRDVEKGTWYYDAVLWAVEQGITNGVSATAFAPDQVCTRAQIVTFLYRMENEPAVTGKSDFKDVASRDAYYYKPVLWAVAREITNGTSENTFSPDVSCTRGQAVTFLYRFFN